MAIGILALGLGVICIAISSVGIREVEPPVRKERAVSYPFPKEI